MKIAVLVKEVPDLEARVQVAEGGASVEVEKKRVLNFFDEIAVEAALKVKEAHGGETYAVSAGAGTGLDALRRALAMGMDGAFHVDDPVLEGADPLTVARALAAVVRREGFDLVVAGKQSTDDETGLVGPMVAECLEVPCVVAATKLELVDGVATVTAEASGGVEVSKAALPLVVTAEKGFCEPRVPQVMGLMKAMRAQIPGETLESLGVVVVAPLTTLAYQGPHARPSVRMIDGEPVQAAAELARCLRDEARVL